MVSEAWHFLQHIKFSKNRFRHQVFRLMMSKKGSSWHRFNITQSVLSVLDHPPNWLTIHGTLSIMMCDCISKNVRVYIIGKTREMCCYMSSTDGFRMFLEQIHHVNVSTSIYCRYYTPDITPHTNKTSVHIHEPTPRRPNDPGQGTSSLAAWGDFPTNVGTFAIFLCARKFLSFQIVIVGQVVGLQPQRQRPTTTLQPTNPLTTNNTTTHNLYTPYTLYPLQNICTSKPKLQWKAVHRWPRRRLMQSCRSAVVPAFLVFLCPWPRTMICRGNEAAWKTQQP